MRDSNGEVFPLLNTWATIIPPGRRLTSYELIALATQPIGCESEAGIWFETAVRNFLHLVPADGSPALALGQRLRSYRNKTIHTFGIRGAVDRHSNIQKWWIEPIPFRDGDFAHYYFAPGCPWIKPRRGLSQSVCPIHVYGPDISRGFVLDTVYLGDDVEAVRTVCGVAYDLSRMLTKAAADPGFSLDRVLRAVRENV